MKLDRRQVITSLVLAPFAGAGIAQELPTSVLALMEHPAAIHFETPPMGSGIPTNVPIQTLTGNHYWMQMFGGRAVLLELWASWCGPCLVETPGLNALAKRYNSNKFAAIALKTADPKTSLSDLQRIYADMNVKNLDILADGSPDGWEYFRSLQVNQRSSGGTAGLPMAALIGPDGREIARTYGTIAGGKWTDPQLMDFIGKFAQSWN